MRKILLPAIAIVGALVLCATPSQAQFKFFHDCSSKYHDNNHIYCNNSEPDGQPQSTTSDEDCQFTSEINGTSYGWALVTCTQQGRSCLVEGAFRCGNRLVQYRSECPFSANGLPPNIQSNLTTGDCWSYNSSGQVDVLRYCRCSNTGQPIGNSCL